MNQGSYRKAAAPREDGMILVAVILLLMIMSALTAALAVSGSTETLIARNHQNAAEARAAAEAGLNHAASAVIMQIENWQANGFASASAAMTDLLIGPDNTTGTTSADADNGSLADLGIAATEIALSGLPDVTYEVRVYDDDDTARGVTLATADITRIAENTNATSDANTTIVVRAIGRASGNAIATIEAMIVPLELPAILTDGSLTISGNPTIAGSDGAVHSNASLTISGSPNVAQDATASATYLETGNPTIGGEGTGSMPELSVPSVRASDYLSRADFILKADGTMTNPSGTVICNASADNDACEDAGYGWEFEGVNGWRINENSDTIISGTYYVEDVDARITGNPGSPSNPLDITIIAEGDIEISGSPDLTPDTAGLLFVTDMDLKISGSPTSTGEAMLLVHEQVEISGNATIAGQIIAENVASVSTLVTTNSISGNMTLTYNGGNDDVFFTVSGWRRAQ